jgi:hypothetical protein
MLVLQPWLDVELANRHFSVRVLTWDGCQSPPDGSLLEQVEFFAPPPASSAPSVLASMTRLRIILLLYPICPAPRLPAHIAVHGPALSPFGDSEDAEQQAKTLLRMQIERAAQRRPLYLPIGQTTQSAW